MCSLLTFSPLFFVFLPFLGFTKKSFRITWTKSPKNVASQHGAAASALRPSSAWRAPKSLKASRDSKCSKPSICCLPSTQTRATKHTWFVRVKDTSHLRDFFLKKSATKNQETTWQFSQLSSHWSFKRPVGCQTLQHFTRQKPWPKKNLPPPVPLRKACTASWANNTAACKAAREDSVFALPAKAKLRFLRSGRWWYPIFHWELGLLMGPPNTYWANLGQLKRKKPHEPNALPRKIGTAQGSLKIRQTMAIHGNSAGDLFGMVSENVTRTQRFFVTSNDRG